MGVTTIIMFSLLIYLVTNNKLISLSTLAALSVWKYSLEISRSVWHPHPVFFFLVIALLFGVVSLKKHKFVYLFICHFAFFISLSIYPSPIFFLPSIFLITIYYFKKNRISPKFHDRAQMILSLIFAWLLVYFPLIIYEINHNFSSINALLESDGPQNILSFSELIIHFGKMLQLLSTLFFNQYGNVTQSLFFLFLLVVTFSFSFMYRSKQSAAVRSFLHPFVLLWFVFVLSYLKNLSIVNAVHRFDVLSLWIFLLFAVALSIVDKFLSGWRKHLIYGINLIVFIAFLVSNIKPSYEYITSINFESAASYHEVASQVTKTIYVNNLSRDNVLIFSVLSMQNRIDKSPRELLIFSKYESEMIDHFVNKNFPLMNPLDDSFQYTLNYKWKIDFLSVDNYFLICRNIDENVNCLQNFIFDLTSLDEKKQYSFVLVNEDIIETEAINAKMYFLKKFQNPHAIK